MRKVVVLDEADLDESFVKGSGNGGQKVNKTSNCVMLMHRPTGLWVKCHETRSLAQNRKAARRWLLKKLDELVNGPASKAAQKADKERRRKSKQRQRARRKYGDDTSAPPPRTAAP